MSLRENVLWFSLKLHKTTGMKGFCKILMRVFYEKVLMKTTKRFSLRDTMKTLRKPL